MVFHEYRNFIWTRVEDPAEIHSLSVQLGLCSSSQDTTPIELSEYNGNNGCALALYEDSKLVALAPFNYRINALLAIRQRFKARLPIRFAPVVLDLLRYKSIRISDIENDFIHMGILYFYGVLTSFSELVAFPIIRGNLNFNNVRLHNEVFPEDRLIDGSLSLCRTNLAELKNVTIRGDLILMYTNTQLINVQVAGQIFR